MKRLFSLFALAAVALVSCSKPANNKAELVPPENKEFHASFTLTDKSFETPIREGKVPRTIDLTSGGKFLLGFRDNDAVNPDKAPLVYVSGEYTVKKPAETKAPGADLVYFFPMYGNLTIQKGDGGTWNIRYTGPDGQSYGGAAALSDEVVSGSLADQMCRSWKPAKLIISASGGDITTAVVGKVFSADLNEIFAYLQEKGLKINTGDYDKYLLESIDYTESGLFIINFKDFAIAPFVGNFKLDEIKEENLSYNFNLSWVDNPVIPVSGTGEIAVNGDTMSLYTESDVTFNSKTHHIAVTIISTEIKD